MPARPIERGKAIHAPHAPHLRDVLEPSAEAEAGEARRHPGARCCWMRRRGRGSAVCALAACCIVIVAVQGSVPPTILTLRGGAGGPVGAGGGHSGRHLRAGDAGGPQEQGATG